MAFLCSISWMVKLFLTQCIAWYIKKFHLPSIHSRYTCGHLAWVAQCVEYSHPNSWHKVSTVTFDWPVLPQPCGCQWWWPRRGCAGCGGSCCEPRSPRLEWLLAACPPTGWRLYPPWSDLSLKSERKKSRNKINKVNTDIYNIWWEKIQTAF